MSYYGEYYSNFETVFYVELGLFVFQTLAALYFVHRARGVLAEAGSILGGWMVRVLLPLAAAGLALAAIFMAALFNGSGAGNMIQATFVVEMLGLGLLMVSLLEVYRFSSGNQWGKNTAIIMMVAVIPAMALWISGADQYRAYHCQIGSYILAGVSVCGLIGTVMDGVSGNCINKGNGVIMVVTAAMMVVTAAYHSYVAYLAMFNYVLSGWEMYLAMVVVMKFVVMVGIEVVLYRIGV